MIYQITEGITVSVEVFYQEAASDPYQLQYLFAYRITIDNHSPTTVQLLRRKWIITEGNGVKRMVEGEGVVGEQPVIESGGSYQYMSAATIRTEIGKMEGYYHMVNLDSHKEMKIVIPAFGLFAPFKLN